MTYCVIWLTGLPGSGKTTIARELCSLRYPLLIPCAVLDGDEVRKTLTKDLGFSREDRRENVRRVTAAVNCFLCNVVVALISPYEEDRLEALAMLQAERRTILVHLDCPLAICEARDPKGMYAKARAGEIAHFTGVDDPYEPPDKPDVYLRTDLLTVEEAVTEILKAVEGPPDGVDE